MRRGPITWSNLGQGPLEADPRRLGGDFVVTREGAGPSYQLAVVVDDARMGITQDSRRRPRAEHIPADLTSPGARLG